LYKILGGITAKEIQEQIESLDNQENKEVMYNFIDDLIETGEDAA
jgi:uncharacterized protein YerC